MKKSIRTAPVIALILMATMPLASWGYGPYPTPRTYNMAPYSSSTGIYVRKSADENNYYLTVLLRNLPAEQLRVDTVRGMLVLQAMRMRQSAGGDHYGGYHTRGYRRYNRRITLPFDADAQKMSVQREEGSVKVTIPRRKR